MNPKPYLVIFHHLLTDKEKIEFISSKVNKHTKVRGSTSHFSPKNVVAVDRTALDTFVH